MLPVSTPMAGTSTHLYFLSCTTPILTHATTRKFRLKPVLARSIFIPLRSKCAKRRNHLRPKILKTLTKPFPCVPLPHVETLPNPPEISTVVDSPAYEDEDFNISETFGTAEPYSGSVGKFSHMSILKFGGCFFVFLLPAIFAFWIVGDTNPDGKERNLSSLDSKDHAIYVNESDVVERINEIKMMAREARKREWRDRNEGGHGKEGNEIEKEVGDKLVKLERSLNSKREKVFPDPFMSYFGLFANVEVEEFNEDVLGSKEKENENTLMFEKKFKFKSHSSMEPMSNAKGFSGSKGRSSLSGASPSDPNGRKAASSQSGLVQNEGNRLEKEGKILGTEMGSGATQGNGEASSSIEVSRAGKSGDLEMQSPQSSRKESQETTIKFDRHTSLSKNCNRDSEERPVAKKIVDKQSDLWWLKLPYVLAIHMHRGSEHEGPGGLFGFRTSQVDDQMDSSYTLAFEDHGDANNFCYLLESFFEDLGDFSADIILLPTNELHEGVKSHSKKVIVLKKGQLKLYAGQPFAEVEMALHYLLEQNQMNPT